MADETTGVTCGWRGCEVSWDDIGCPECGKHGYGFTDAEDAKFIDQLRAKNRQLTEALGRLADRRMWRRRNGELVWAGETPDGNEVETDDPRDIAWRALSPKEADDA